MTSIAEPPHADSQPPGILAALRAFVRGRTDFDVSALEPSTVRQALARGLGPVLAHVSGAPAKGRGASEFDAIASAALTAQVLTAVKYDTMKEVLAAAAAVECRPVLLKGIATALRYYAAPHLRTMGDIDLLVPENRQASIEVQLRDLGFTPSSRPLRTPAPRRHHGTPFHHPERGVWIEIHTRLYPQQFPLASHPRFAPEAIRSQLVPFDVGGMAASVMTHELQLVYTSTRWAERFDPRRGVFPVLDAALLLERQGDALDWDRVCGLARGSWAATALRLMLSYLQRSGLARPPAPVICALEAMDPYANRVCIAMLHRLVARYVVGDRPFGPVLSEHNLRLSWWGLVRPAPLYTTLLKLPRRLLRAGTT